MRVHCSARSSATTSTIARRPRSTATAARRRSSARSTCSSRVPSSGFVWLAQAQRRRGVARRWARASSATPSRRRAGRWSPSSTTSPSMRTGRAAASAAACWRRWRSTCARRVSRASTADAIATTRRVALLRADGFPAARRGAHRDAAVTAGTRELACSRWFRLPAAARASAAALPKQYAPLAGRPLLARTLDRLREALRPRRDRRGHRARRPALRSRDRRARRRHGRCAAAAPRAARRSATRCRRWPERAATTTGSWSTMRRAPACRAMRWRGWSRTSSDDAVGGLLADSGRRHAEARRRRCRRAARAAHRGPRAACGRRRRRRCSATACWRARSRSPRRAIAPTRRRRSRRSACAPRLVRGSAANLKVTFPDDLALAAAILAAQAQVENAS